MNLIDYKKLKFHFYLARVTNGFSNKSTYRWRQRRFDSIRNPIFARLCEPTEFEVEGWKKIISVEKCLNQFIPGAWANLQLNTRKIECNIKTGEGILPSW